MNHRIVVVTSEIPAQMGYPTAGGGLRAWNLAEGLRRRGFEVIYALEENVVHGRSLPEEHTRFTWNSGNLNQRVLEAAPDVLIFCQWPPMTSLHKAPCPVVVDLFGLLLLENWFRQDGDIQVQAQAKLRTLAKADAFLVTSPTLKAYFTAWLTMAGVHPEDFPVMHVPISLPDEMPPLPVRTGDEEINFVYSGIFWPWQNPLLPLRTLAETLEHKGRGRLIIYGGKHPVHELPPEVAEEASGFLHHLEKSSQVEVRGVVPHEELMASFADMDAAVDLMAPNIERELSSPIRSACYLWAGLPPVVNNYLYFARDLEAAGAGWIADPSDSSAMTELFEYLIDHPEEVFARREKAQAFAHQRHTWTPALAPLADFCSSPRFREKHRHLLDTTIERLTELEETKSSLEETLRQQREEYETELRELKERVHIAEHDLQAIRSKFFFRFFKRMQDLIAPHRKPRG